MQVGKKAGHPENTQVVELRSRWRQGNQEATWTQHASKVTWGGDEGDEGETGETCRLDETTRQGWDWT